MNQEIPSHQARARLEIEGRPYDVIEVEGEESINLGFYLLAVVLAQPHERSDAFIGRRFTLQLQGRNGDARRIAGIVTENLYRSASGNTLLMGDRKARELVRLYPANGLLHLELNAKEAAHWAGLVTPQGAIEQQAGKVIAFTSGDSHIEQIDNDRIQQVENRSRTQTKRGKIHHQAGSDIQLAAGESIHIEAGQDVEISAGGDFSLTAKTGRVRRYPKEIRELCKKGREAGLAQTEQPTTTGTSA